MSARLYVCLNLWQILCAVVKKQAYCGVLLYIKKVSLSCKADLEIHCSDTFSSSAVVYSRCIISEINIVYCFVYVTLLSANVQALSYTELSCGAMIIFCPPAALPSPSSPLRTLELIVCLILKNIMAQEKSSISRRWGDFWEVGEGVKQLLKEPFLAPRLIEKHYALPAAGTVKKANKWCLERASFFIRSHFFLLPVVLISKCVFVWHLIILSNYILMLITPVHGKNWFVIKANACYPDRSSFYSAAMACIWHLWIILKQSCGEILWQSPNLVTSVKGELIQRGAELDPGNKSNLLWHSLPHYRAGAKPKPKTVMKNVRISKEAKY